MTLTAVNVGALAVSGGDVTGEIRMNGQSISGLNDPTEESQAARKGYVDAAKTAANAYTDASVRKAAPRNLLDNSDFRNPVNQRGKKSYTAAGYTIDRWISQSSKIILSVKDGYIRTESTTSSETLHVRQHINLVCRDETKVTFAIKARGSNFGICYYGTGTNFKSYDDWTILVYNYTIPAGTDLSASPNYNPLFTFTSGGYIEVQWAALYEGTYTAETLPEYHPKGYVAELAECQRYYYTIRSDGSSYAAYATGTMNDARSAYFPIVFPTPMRISPTLSYSGSFRVYVNGSGRPITDIVNNAQSRYSSRITIGNISGGVLGQACELQSNSDAKAFIAFSADL